MTSVADRYLADGFVSGLSLLDPAEAADHRAALELAEGELGPLHYIDKVHTVVRSAYELCRHDRVLDVVEQLIGPNILLYNSTYIIKEPAAAAKVNWHQDLTYWGLADHDAQVSMWLALSPATEASGCMSMIPASHLGGAREHETGSNDGNLLLLGQQLTAVDESSAVVCSLEPGEASFHHGWTVHASAPNRSDDRRIGLNVQFLAAHNRHLVDEQATSLLVRGVDNFGHFGLDRPAQQAVDHEAVPNWRKLDEQAKANFKTQ